jgi:hypothetical protein
VNPIAILALILKLAPELRVAVVELVKAIRGEDETAARAAYEAARRAAFKARQKGVVK